MPYAYGDSIHPAGDYTPILWIGQKKNEAIASFFFCARATKKIFFEVCNKVSNSHDLMYVSLIR